MWNHDVSDTKEVERMAALYDEDGTRAASIIHTMFDLERSGRNVLPELEAYLLLLLTGIKAYHAKRNLSSVYSSYCFCSVYCFASAACKHSH